MDGQACLHRHMDIRRATDGERHLCRELCASQNQRRKYWLQVECVDII